MTTSAVAAASFCGTTIVLHIVSIIVAAWRCRPRPVAKSTTALPPVSLVRPICGLDNFLEETLRTSFELAYPTYELIFCVASTRDPAIAVVQELIAAYPQSRARLLVGDDRVSNNPKLNNCVKGWQAAQHGWIAIADSNVMMPPDYIQRLLAAWKPDTGLVCSPPVGCRPIGFWAGLECAFLNTYQVRAQYFVDTLGFGFAQGKTMLWRRGDLEAAGGIRALGAEPAEDAASTKIVRAAGLRVRLTDLPVGQPLGRRRMTEMAAANSLGTAASPLLPAVFRAGNSRRCDFSAHRRRICGQRGRHIDLRHGCGTVNRLVRRRSRTGEGGALVSGAALSTPGSAA